MTLSAIPSLAAIRNASGLYAGDDVTTPVVHDGHFWRDEAARWWTGSAWASKPATHSFLSLKASDGINYPLTVKSADGTLLNFNVRTTA